MAADEGDKLEIEGIALFFTFVTEQVAVCPATTVMLLQVSDVFVQPAGTTSLAAYDPGLMLLWVFEPEPPAVVTVKPLYFGPIVAKSNDASPPVAVTISVIAPGNGGGPPLLPQPTVGSHVVFTPQFAQLKLMVPTVSPVAVPPK